MGSSVRLSRLLLAVLPVVVLAPEAARAQQGLSIDVATFEQGRFVIAGTAAPGAEVRVAGTELFEIADPATGVFRIARRTVLPGCTIDVEAGEARASVPVANCRTALLGVETPQPTTLLRPRGGWGSTRSYRSNDVVDFQGRQWRAVKASRGRQPGLPGTEVFWAELDPGALEATATDPEAGAEDEAALPN